MTENNIDNEENDNKSIRLNLEISLLIWNLDKIGLLLILGYYSVRRIYDLFLLGRFHPYVTEINLNTTIIPMPKILDIL